MINLLCFVLALPCLKRSLVLCFSPSLFPRLSFVFLFYRSGVHLKVWACTVLRWIAEMLFCGLNLAQIKLWRAYRVKTISDNIFETPMNIKTFSVTLRECVWGVGGGGGVSPERKVFSVKGLVKKNDGSCSHGIQGQFAFCWLGLRVRSLKCNFGNSSEELTTPSEQPQVSLCENTQPSNWPQHI